MNSLKAKTSLTAKVTNTMTSVKSFFTEPKRFVNHDGTLAENKETYKEFRQDIISSFGRC